jgi:CRP-like cAMP-binding protein
MEISLRELRELASAVGKENDMHLSESISVVTYRPNQVIYRSGEKFEGIKIILRGIVKNVSCVDGQLVIPALMVPGDVLGSEAFYSGTHFNESVASSEVDAISIPSNTFDVMIRTSAHFRAYLSEALARALAESALMINILANARAEVRVIFYLLKIYTAMSKGKSQPGFVDLALSRTEIGDFLGLNRETVSRKLTTLTACGLIRIAGRRVELRDPEALRRICGHIVLLT